MLPSTFTRCAPTGPFSPLVFSTLANRVQEALCHMDKTVSHPPPKKAPTRVPDEPSVCLPLLGSPRALSLLTPNKSPQEGKGGKGDRDCSRTPPPDRTQGQQLEQESAPPHERATSSGSRPIVGDGGVPSQIPSSNSDTGCKQPDPPQAPPLSPKDRNSHYDMGVDSITKTEIGNLVKSLPSLAALGDPSRQLSSETLQGISSANDVLAALNIPRVHEHPPMLQQSPSAVSLSPECLAVSSVNVVPESNTVGIGGIPPSQSWVCDGHEEEGHEETSPLSALAARTHPFEVDPKDPHPCAGTPPNTETNKAQKRPSGSSSKSPSTLPVGVGMGYILQAGRHQDYGTAAGGLSASERRPQGEGVWGSLQEHTGSPSATTSPSGTEGQQQHRQQPGYRQPLQQQELSLLWAEGSEGDELAPLFRFLLTATMEIFMLALMKICVRWVNAEETAVEVQQLWANKLAEVEEEAGTEGRLVWQSNVGSILRGGAPLTRDFFVALFRRQVLQPQVAVETN
uniref:Uncharacterized protein n=1 Tax=Chromera velia CCMP2878 TaxID=1169474 RepID=A0A0G4GPL8_9ALVE|eukprot:Cvel_22803.t1-p1 / transcript=Cvel_22803.t1 / gene=Cvel_22803 / organism=Chromera_velia_CCMP2878 / gene_product=hypothetical protein / transcript_product=hypothetical protein / location=Cvel_scaffold2282:8106-15736(+) / protein_length=511 / sequence_SO=supercontig / SO=protein_coding / is_pseudo=false